MTPAEHIAMQIGYLVICCAVVIVLAGVLVLAVWALHIALGRALDSYGSIKVFREFLKWRRYQESLAEQWENMARCKLQSAEMQTDEAERRFVEHGAICYFKCAQELREMLTAEITANPPVEG